MTLSEIVKVLDNLEPDERWARAAELPSDMLLAWLDHQFSADQLRAAHVAEALERGDSTHARLLGEEKPPE